MVIRAPNTRLPRGHTLWEMLLVLAVLGAVCGLAAPAVRAAKPQAGAASQVAREIVALIDNARLTALQCGTAVEVRVDPSSGQAWVFAAEGDTMRLVWTPRLERLSAVEILADGEPRLRYAITPDGQTFGRPVVLHGADGTRQIIVDPWTRGASVSR